MSDLMEFVTGVVRHWIGWVTGSALTVVQFVVDRFTALRVPGWFILAGLVLGVPFSLFRAWQDEQRGD